MCYGAQRCQGCGRRFWIEHRPKGICPACSGELHETEERRRETKGGFAGRKDCQAHRKKDRLTSANLCALVAAYGFPFPDIDAIASASEYVLLHERLSDADWERRVEAHACTPEQRDDPAFGYYQRGLTWVEHIETHAESVIADFERAVRLNSACEPLVEKHLKRARKIARKRSKGAAGQQAQMARPRSVVESSRSPRRLCASR